jgi:acetyl esterase/lipase
MEVLTRTQVMRCATLAVCLVTTLASGVNAQVSSPNPARQSDVIYGRKFGVALTMEVFRPASRNGIGILWVVSSSGRSSREQTLSDSFERRIAPLLERGNTVFAVIHGSAPVFNLQDQVSDVRRAVRFVRQRAAEFGVDGDRLGIGGSSAGGLLALIVAMDAQDGNPASDDPVERASSRLQAVGCFFAPTDLTNFGAPAASILDWMQSQGGKTDPTFHFYELDARTGARQPVTSREAVLSVLRDFSPATHVNSEAPPTILVHGEQDRAVPVQQSRWLVERLSQAKVPARLVVREGVGHAYPGWEGDGALLADWFGQHLRHTR